jgi:hypothetical protein
MLLLLSAIKMVAEIALFAFAGQWLLGLLVGAKREVNFSYRLLSTLTAPFIRGVRLIAPHHVTERHLPFAAAALLAVIWIAVTGARIVMCLQIGVSSCR